MSNKIRIMRADEPVGEFTISKHGGYILGEGYYKGVAHLFGGLKLIDNEFEQHKTEKEVWDAFEMRHGPVYELEKL